MTHLGRKKDRQTERTSQPTCVHHNTLSIMKTIVEYRFCYYARGYLFMLSISAQVEVPIDSKGSDVLILFGLK